MELGGLPLRKVALVLMLLTLVSKIFGLMREVIVSYYYGASYISDAYIISLTIPTIIFSFIGAGIATSFIPMYSNIEKIDGTKRADKFTSNLLLLVFIVSTCIILLVLEFTSPIIKLFASGFNEETLVLAITFTKISIFSIYFIGLGYVFKSYLQLKNSFISSGITGIFFNSIIVIFIILSYKYNLYLLSIGIVVAVLAEVFFLVPYMKKMGYKISINFNLFNDKYLKRMCYLAIPVILGTSVNQINILVDRTLASQIAVGGISALNYANKLNLFIQGIFVITLATVLYPSISRMAAKNDIEGLKSKVIGALNIITVIILPISVLAMVFSEQIVEIVFGRGAFGKDAILMTSEGLFYYALGMIGMGHRQILTRAFFALQDTKTPMYNAAFAMILNIILNLILSKYLGLGGLALATSISALLTSGLLYYNLYLKIGDIGFNKMVKSYLKIISASLVVGLLSKFLYNLLFIQLGTVLSLITATFISFALYVFLVYLLRVEGISDGINMIKKKIK